MESFSVSEYLERHRVKEELEDAVNELVKDRPRAPFLFLANFLLRKFSPVSTIEKVVAREVLDSRGNPTVQTDIYCNIGGNIKLVGQGTAPSGSSTGSNEALELRDKDQNRYDGKGVAQAVRNVSQTLNAALTGVNPCHQLAVDKLLCDADGTDLKTHLGGNALTSVSFGIAAAGATVSEIPLFQHISNLFFGEKTPALTLPVPMVNILNGGKHAGGKLKFQEFMILPKKGIAFTEAVRHVTSVYHQLGKNLSEGYGSSARNLGDEGGYAPQIETPEEALQLIEQAVADAGFEIGTDIKLAIDAAASEFYSVDSGQYEPQEGVFMTSDQLVEYYCKLVEAHPHLVSIEDGMAEKDYEGWTRLTQRLGADVMIVGDDLFTTNTRLLSRGIEEKWANALLLKVNQIGTLSEAQDAARMAFAAGQQVVVSHRSGESTSSLIADLAVGIGAGFIKTGAPARGERVAKYNRLLQIEEMLSAETS